MSEKLRKCSKCGEEKPATIDFFHKESKVKSGLKRACRECENKRKNAYNRKHKDHILKKKNEIFTRINASIGEKYRTLHIKMRKIKEKTELCTICHRKERLHLASIDHVYTHNPNDWIWLCQSCHIEFDKCRGVMFG